MQRGDMHWSDSVPYITLLHFLHSNPNVGSYVILFIYLFFNFKKYVSCPFFFSALLMWSKDLSDATINYTN